MSVNFDRKLTAQYDLQLPLDAVSLPHDEPVDRDAIERYLGKYTHVFDDMCSYFEKQIPNELLYEWMHSTYGSGVLARTIRKYLIYDVDDATVHSSYYDAASHHLIVVYTVPITFWMGEWMNDYYPYADIRQFGLSFSEMVNAISCMDKSVKMLGYAQDVQFEKVAKFMQYWIDNDKPMAYVHAMDAIIKEDAKEKADITYVVGIKDDNHCYFIGWNDNTDYYDMIVALDGLTDEVADEEFFSVQNEEGEEIQIYRFNTYVEAEKERKSIRREFKGERVVVLTLHKEDGVWTLDDREAH